MEAFLLPWSGGISMEERALGIVACAVLFCDGERVLAVGGNARAFGVGRGGIRSEPLPDDPPYAAVD
ncbi:MAG: hypothetical protein INR62_13700 [Rhodospirillales bacterium]|nr:hypothetical protein [Acetobacter sp.]